jgi:hypothetical protein
MPNVIEREDPSTPNTFMTKVVSYITLKRRIDDMTKESSEIKSDLSDLVDTEGEPDENGHLWLRLPESVDGITALQRQRRVSQSLDEDAAEKLLKEKGLFDRCYVMQPVLKEDEVMACLYEGLITEEEVDAMFPKKVTWAFLTSKA